MRPVVKMRLFNVDKLVVVGLLLTIAIAYASYRGYQTRKIFQSLQKQGIVSIEKKRKGERMRMFSYR
jgi:hypothetical protein